MTNETEQQLAAAHAEVPACDPFDYLICLNCDTRYDNVQRDNPKLWAESLQATPDRPFRCPTCRVNLDFGQALSAMRAGRRVRRAGWPASHHLHLIKGARLIDIHLGGDVVDFWNEHYILRDAEWIDDDILAADWQILEEEGR